MEVLDKNKLLMAFGSTTRLILKQMQAGVKERDVTYSMDQLFVLVLVRFKGEKLVQQDLVDIMEKDKSVILRMVDVLENDGLLRRVVDSQDRRRNILEVTEKGIELSNVFVEVETKVSADLLDGVSEEELGIFYKVVGHIRENACTV